MKASLKILMRNNYRTKDGKQQICLRYTAYRQCTFIGLNISVNPKFWNSNSCRILSGEPRYLFFNKLIKEMYHKADSIIMDNYLKPLPVKEFIDKLKDNQYGNTDFYIFIENEIELLKASRASGTIANYYKLINTMKEWKPTLSFDEITLEYIQRFHNHELEMGNQLSTIYKKHANFKFLLGLAVDKEVLEKNPYEKFEIKKNIKAQNNDVLTEEELQRLQTVYDKNVYKDGKQEVLREFLFSCFTGIVDKNQIFYYYTGLTDSLVCRYFYLNHSKIFCVFRFNHNLSGFSGSFSFYRLTISATTYNRIICHFSKAAH